MFSLRLTPLVRFEFSRIMVLLPHVACDRCRLIGHSSVRRSCIPTRSLQALLVNCNIEISGELLHK